MKSQITQDLRRLLLPWSFALLLPMPMLLVMADAANSDIATLYLALGYVSADWPTAKLMISLTWTGALLLSGAAVVHCDRSLHR